MYAENGILISTRQKKTNTSDKSACTCYKRKKRKKEHLTHAF